MTRTRMITASDVKAGMVLYVLVDQDLVTHHNVKVRGVRRNGYRVEMIIEGINRMVSLDMARRLDWVQ